ncbi:DUF3383 family protein [Peptoniphilus sp. BV3C26]|uniref:DUF3383 family protein n=1 Tax=Peptoniphilus sp. BV3C26 TaxID=1111134 RepID=UPI0003B8EA99|nr:DUF3383 family protein [Peptoniphilus sp. BV3C26]ERT62228.1 PF11863 domain protein [Peptoniphilus sp. BV3C26]
MILDFPVNIQRKTVGVSERGFGTILILDTENDYDLKYIEAEDVKDLDANSKAYKLASRLFMQKPQPQEVAIVGKKGDAVAGFKKVLEENSDFFFVTCIDNSVETIKGISQLCQVENKVYAVTVNKIEDAKALEKEVFDNTFVMYHTDAESYAAEALTVIMSYKIGGKTAKFKTIQGVKECEISRTDLAELEKNNIFTYIEKLGVLQTTEGKMLSGEYIDVVLGEYWIRFRLEEALQRLALVEDKIPYTNKGIGMIVGETEKILSRAVDQGIVEEGQYKVDYRLRQDVPSNEVALRKYDYVVWTALLQGAIHTGQISGILTYDTVNEEDK